MLGTRLRSWMETHIVRARKKQNRSKGKGKNLQDSPSTSPHLNYDQPRGEKDGKICKEISQYSVDKTPMTDERKEKGNCAVTNLSSPESAYSTGYSTDGTSPGASIPPEYYINLRTGKHYVQANTGNTGTSEAVQCGTAQTSSPKQAAALTPSSARRRREEIIKRKTKPIDGLPESSTEEDIADRPTKSTPSHKVITPKFQRKTTQATLNVSHRRTESYDGSQRFTTGTERDSEGSSSTHTGGSTHCVSPFLSSASPRQRNRIRTNPWLGTASNLQIDKSKNYNSQGETSSTVGSSSTLSSSGYREKFKDELPLYSPKAVEKKLDDLRNLNVVRCGNFIASPLVNGRRPVNTVTTCSPQPNRPCRHIRPGTSSSSTSAPSSGSDDNHHGNSSDFSDDDVTLNEMGKYDESYVYEKETDILSDSDPTDCDEQQDYNGKLINRGHCSYYGGNHTPDMCKRQCSRMRRQRSSGDGSAASSRGSSLSNRRMRRPSSRRSEDLHHPSAETTPKRFRKKHRQPSKERMRSVDSLQKDVIPGQIIPQPGRIDSRITAVPDLERKNLDQGRHINLNRVLMERIINQRSGTRSADGTPVSLRKNGALEYNGKYLKNPHVSKLINSNCNLMEKRTGVDDKNLSKKDSPLAKKRSNSLTGYNVPIPIPPALPPRNPTRVGNNSIDKEGDLKYRQLIQEAEHILEDFQIKTFHKPEYMSPTLSTKSAIVPNTQPRHIPFQRYPNACDIKSQINLLEETINNNPVPKIENEEGILKTISKTLERIMIRNSESKRGEKTIDSLKSKKKTGNQHFQNQMQAKSPIRNTNVTEIFQENDYVNNAISLETTSIDRNDNFYRNTFTFNPKVRNQNSKSHSRQNSNGGDKDQFKKSKGVDIIRNGDPPYSPRHPSPKMQPLNSTHPTKPRNALTLWQDNELSNFQNNQNMTDKTPTPKTPLVPFKSFDLGNQVAVESKYCPQSEPVKRKVYVCSSTFDKLQKSLMRNAPENNYDITNMSTDALRDENMSLKEKVAQLRRERLQVEARVRETQEQIDRLRLADASSHC